ncbi:FAD-dependent oxidoreductase [Falsarthrobacter nasiphocae]|uniref:Glycine oxidase n=1 Tax=Falsarthrobacter nasiphocae TaxID=189863 RepID=A0AAE3YJ57_9MICC|nr:FAD-dependent oxidoreductase [Falsarthrobacter nasiphocae]MDR6892948.1 glycine oxidase [Falsarthrobacter nasiphocae]
MSGTRTAAHVVIGAGVIGLATAWELASRGEDVLVLDPTPGRGASWAAAGMIAPVSEQVPGEEALAAFTRASAAMHTDFLARLVVPGEDADVDLGRTGTLVVAVDQADVRELALTERLLAAEPGRAEQRLTVREARRLEPALSPRIGAALRVETDQWLDPRRLASRLMAALESRRPGSVVRERALSVVAASGGGGDDAGWRIETTAGEVSAQRTVIVAAALGTSVLRTPAAPHTPLHAERGDVLRIRPLDREDVPGRVIRAFVRGRQTYIVPRADGTVVIGATVRTDDVSGTHVGATLDLLNDAVEVVPALRESTLEDITTRDRPATRDHLPVLGVAQSPAGDAMPGLVWATGFDRHGVLLAPWAARSVADHVLAGQPFPQPVNPYRSAS